MKEFKDPITGVMVKESDIRCECCNSQITISGICHRIARNQSLITGIRCGKHKSSSWVSINYLGKEYKGNTYEVAGKLNEAGLSCEVCNKILSISSIAHRIQRGYDFNKPMKCNSCNWNSNEHRLFRIYHNTLRMCEPNDKACFYIAMESLDSATFKFGITTNIDRRNGMFKSNKMDYSSILTGTWEDLCRLEYEVKLKFTSEDTFNKYGSNEVLSINMKQDIIDFVKSCDISKLSKLPDYNITSSCGSVNHSALT